MTSLVGGGGVEQICCVSVLVASPEQTSEEGGKHHQGLAHPITGSAFIIPHSTFKAWFFPSFRQAELNPFQLPTNVLARILHPWVTCHSLPPPNHTTFNPASGLTTALCKMPHPCAAQCSLSPHSLWCLGLLPGSLHTGQLIPTL